MSKNIADHDERKSKIIYWESQAEEVIKLVLTNKDNTVVETDHIHPVLFFSSSKKLIQYTLKKGEKGNDVLGTVFQQDERNDFFTDAFREYKDYYTSIDIKRFFENYFSDEFDRKYIFEAQRQKDVMRGYLAENKYDKLNVLIAYGGGKDSTMALVFLRYVQELFNIESKNPLVLHILVHLHPGMREGVFINIRNVINKLGLNNDKNVKITFKTKNYTYSKECLDKFFNDTYRISMPAFIKKVFRRELLLLGHLSKGLGRHTFCYSCNIDMIMTIIEYSIDPQNKIDYVVTGDSSQEKDDYTKWTNSVFQFINKSENSKKNQNVDGKKTFIDNFTKLQNRFSRYYFGAESLKQSKNSFIKYPNLLNIFEGLDFHVDTFRGMLNELGFEFHDDAFNFSETDCFYPAVMAHWAGRRGGHNYEEHLKAHIEHVKEKMSAKNFPKDLIYKASSAFTSDNKVKDGYTFLSETFDIQADHITSLIYSPFLDNCNRLQSFLNDPNHNIKGFSASEFVDYLQNGIVSSVDVKEAIDTFITDWIGLEHKDIKTIMNYSEKPSADNDLIEVIAQGDPYVDKVNIYGDEIIISGR